MADMDKRLQGVRILAVEDVEVNMLVLEDMLTYEGAEAAYAVNGEEALARYREADGGFDVVLMDVQMPVMNGLVATRKILESWPDATIIGLTGHELVTEQQHCFDAGMVAHVTKPVEENILIQTILRHIEQRDAEDDPMHSAYARLSGDETRVVDWDVLGYRYAGREAFIERLVASALKSHKGIGRELRRLAHDGEVSAIGEVAHGIKSMAGNLAANALQQLAMQTETCALHDNDATGYVALELATMLDDLITELEHHQRYLKKK